LRAAAAAAAGVGFDDGGGAQRFMVSQSSQARL